MTRYYYDTEFLEGTQTETFLGIPKSTILICLYGLVAFTLFYINSHNSNNDLIVIVLGCVFLLWAEYLSWKDKKTKPKPTIDLISIGIVAEDGRELYLISKDFNLREAWDRYQIKTGYNHGDIRNHIGDKWEKKEYWIRENVLRPIFTYLLNKDVNKKYYDYTGKKGEFTYKNLKRLINMYGYTNAEIAEKVKEFVGHDLPEYQLKNNLPEFYGYYADYDHVALCWLFGKMIDLPEGFPMYTIDLKQMLDEKQTYVVIGRKPEDWDSHPNNILAHPDYPQNNNEHNALGDARFNKELHEFIQSL